MENAKRLQSQNDFQRASKNHKKKETPHTKTTRNTMYLAWAKRTWVMLVY